MTIARPFLYTTSAFVLCTTTAAVANASTMPALTEQHRFDIPAQSLNQALVKLSQQSGVSVFFAYDSVRPFKSRPVRGSLTTQEALDRLIEGTTLRISGVGPRAVSISAAQASRHGAKAPRPVRLALASRAMPLGAAVAPDAGATAPAETAAGESIIVTGTRTTSRTVADSLAPIDVLSAKDLDTSGKQSVRDLLGTLVPSINVSNSGAGASFAVKTLSLRGLSGDQLLVLVNGKRRHNSANIFINGTTQNGQSPADLDLIPSNAIARIEVLRDGAAAQYGSDAIAGVINIILKDDVSGSASILGGTTADGGGTQGRWRIDKGFRLGTGTLHLSADGYMQGRTVRSAPNEGRFYAYQGQLYSATSGTPDPREATVDRNVNKGGQPQVYGGNLSYNLVMPTDGGVEFYSFGTGSKRQADAYLTFRYPDASNNIPEIFPNGYIPHLYLDDTDYQVAGGVRGEGPGGIRFDFSTTYAMNRIKYREETALNVSLGPDGPTEFDIGSLKNTQWTTNLDLSKEIDLGLAEPLLVAVGGEYREDGFTIGAGEPNSYIDGGYVSVTGANAGVIRTSGSQGVTGFPASSAGTWKRHNWSAYIDLEQKIVSGVEFALAGRHEDYSDFGTTNTGKASLRIEPVRGFALRGTASTGFRAPTLQQEHYSSSSTIGVTIDGVTQLLPVQALPVDTPAAIALGAAPLKPEKSTNYSLGAVFNALPGFNLTVDAYQIKIRDRILLSSTLTGTTVMQVLNDAGITNSAGGFYFSNAADTRTRGLDIVGTYRQNLGALGSATFSLSANFNKTVFTHVDSVPDELAAAGLELLGRDRIGDFTKGTPRNKFIANILWTMDPLTVNLRATRYGEVTQVNRSGAAYDQTIDPKVVFDLELGYRIGKGIKASVGANNLFNVYPNKLPYNLSSSGFAKYNAYSPYGTSGGFYYGRLSFDF